MIHEIICNILDAPCEIIVQNNNCFCTQSSGVAKAIRAKYSEVYTEDCKTTKGDKSKLGTILPVKILNPDNNIKYCFLCYGQYNFGTEKRQVNYEAIFRCLESVVCETKNLGYKKIAIPCYMCCVLAGGSWHVIKAMIEEIFLQTDLEIYICKLPKQLI